MINLFTHKGSHANDFYISKSFEELDIDIEKLQREQAINSDAKFIYLSFDDGPLNGSQNINAIAQKYQVPMNVMVVGEHVFMNATQKKYFNNYKQNPYVEVNNHSFSHANNRYYKYYAKPTTVLKDFNKSMNLLGLDNKIARLPGRNVWSIDGKEYNRHKETKDATRLLTQNGYKLIGWDIEWQYNRKTKYPVDTHQEFFAKLKHHIESNKKLFTPNNIVVLLHDPMFRKDSSELENFIQLIQAQTDYIIMPLSRYPVTHNRVVYNKHKDLSNSRS